MWVKCGALIAELWEHQELVIFHLRNFRISLRRRERNSLLLLGCDSMKCDLVSKAEEYVFGACALREEIKRRKHTKEKHRILNEIFIRVLFIYACTFGIIFCVCGLFLQSANSIVSSIEKRK